MNITQRKYETKKKLFNYENGSTEKQKIMCINFMNKKFITWKCSHIFHIHTKEDEEKKNSQEFKS